MKKRNGTVNGLIPAAQYIRMSTEHQRFSPDNQKAVIAIYAAANGFEIVATYQDSGKSGLSLKGRPELKRLLADVLTEPIPFRAILVLDVSRWGRFQDADQSAHYEYMCREAGAPVRYCGELFPHDGGGMASMLKHMKRIMAAEYSRELSVRISRAQHQQARLGFKQGAPAVYGTRRMVVTESGQHRFELEPGERKALSTDKVLFVRGPRSEVALIQRIFRMYVVDEMRISQIVAWLDRKGKTHLGERPWVYSTIRFLLRNPIYTGTYIFGKRANNLGDCQARPPSEWVICDVIKPIISAELFRLSTKRMEETTRRSFPDEEIFRGLKRLLKEEGFISMKLIGDCAYLPNPEVIARRYGNLQMACRMIGYEKPKRHPRTLLYSDSQLVDHIKRIFAENGYISQRLIDGDVTSPPGSCFKKRLGGLFNAYSLAGISMLPDANRLDGMPSQRVISASKPRKRGKHIKADGSLMGNADLVESLKHLMKRHGYLSEALINGDLALPTAQYFRDKFGSLTKAYALAGFRGTHSEIVKAAYERRRSMKASAPF